MGETNNAIKMFDQDPYLKEQVVIPVRTLLKQTYIKKLWRCELRRFQYLAIVNMKPNPSRVTRAENLLANDVSRKLIKYTNLMGRKINGFDKQ
jgi:hypothetical protein